MLGFEQIIFASPVYWYSLSPAMKVFMDRLSDLLDLPDLLDKGRQLRGKRAFILSTSIQTEVSAHFVGALRETFEYLGIHYGGCLHADCKDGYAADNCTADIQRFVVALKAAA